MGSDKAELNRAGVSMLAFSKQLLSDAGVDQICVSRNVGEGVRDVIEQSGPLGGIYSAIKSLDTDAVLILPIDMPLLEADDLVKLVAAGQQHLRPVCYDDCYLPLYLPVNQAVSDYLHEQLFNDGDRRVKALIKQFNGIQIPMQDKTNLVNTNTPQQWQQTQTHINSRGHHGT
jgi:molybdopterin-guanine dinucleotide biosynthesis protein A